VDDLADVVYWALDGLNPPWGIQCIYLHGLELQGLVAPVIRECLQELPLGSFLVVGV
jgi:hypothetical protein